MVVDIQQNWDTLIKYMHDYIPGEHLNGRRDKLIKLYTHYEDRIKILPASTKPQFHSAFDGGYVYHVLNVCKAALVMQEAWIKLGTHVNWTTEELIFAAINHDLGKIGDENGPIYVANDSQWHIKNRGELYKFNDKIPFMAVHDRSLFILQQWSIPCSYNETLAIRLHGGLWDEGTKEYLVGYNKPNTALPYILHQADLAAARIEFEQQYLHAPKSETASFPRPTSDTSKFSKRGAADKILSNSPLADDLKNTLKNIL
jgi:hypothetical protein